MCFWNATHLPSGKARDKGHAAFRSLRAGGRALGDTAKGLLWCLSRQLRAPWSSPSFCDGCPQGPVTAPERRFLGCPQDAAELPRPALLCLSLSAALISVISVSPHMTKPSLRECRELPPSPRAHAGGLWPTPPFELVTCTCQHNGEGGNPISYSLRLVFTRVYWFFVD